MPEITCHFWLPKNCTFLTKKFYQKFLYVYHKAKTKSFKFFLTYQRTATISFLNYVLYFKTKMFTDKLKKLQKWLKRALYLQYSELKMEKIIQYTILARLCPNLSIQFFQKLYFEFIPMQVHIPKIAPFFHCFPMVSSYFRIVSKDFSPIREKADSLCLSFPLSIQTFFFCNLDFYSIQLILI